MGQYTGLDKDDDFPYSVIDYREKFPYPDNNFFFCSALMVLHYSKDIDFTLKEINRVMEKDGFLLIQEHDNFSIVDDMLAELGNTWRMTFNSVVKNTELNFNEVEQSIYYCWYEWDLILREYGFRYLWSSRITLSVTEAIGSDRPFIFLCQKIKDL